MKSNKIVSLLLVATMVLSMGVMLSGCGSDKGDEAQIETPIQEEPMESVKEEAQLDEAKAQEALNKAEELLMVMNYSHSGLVNYLVDFGGFTLEEATYAADNCSADWNEQAAAHIGYYRSAGQNMSADDMRGQLEYEGYTDEQIDYAIEKMY